MSGTRPFALALAEHRLDLGALGAGREIEPLDAEPAEDPCDQRLGRGVERARMDDDVARLDEGQEQGGDRRHAASRRSAPPRPPPRSQAILEYLLVRAR